MRCVIRGLSLSFEKEPRPALGDLGVGSADSEMRTHVGRVGIRLGPGWGPGGRAPGLGGTGASQADPSLTPGWAGVTEPLWARRDHPRSWLRGKELESSGFVPVRGQPSVCTSQVCCGRAQGWPPSGCGPQWASRRGGTWGIDLLWRSLLEPRPGEQSGSAHVASTHVETGTCPPGRGAHEGVPTSGGSSRLPSRRTVGVRRECACRGRHPAPVLPQGHTAGVAPSAGRGDRWTGRRADASCTPACVCVLLGPCGGSQAARGPGRRPAPLP